MSDGKNLPIKYSGDEIRRIEEAAALAGYKHLSTYIRDKSLDRTGRQDTLENWADKQELMGRLAAIEQGLVEQKIVLASILFLVKRKSTSGDVNELRAALAHAIQVRASDVMAELEPEFAQMFRRLSEEQ